MHVDSPQRRVRVVEVRVETGGGGEAEARMRVLSLPALAEMRPVRPPENVQ